MKKINDLSSLKLGNHTIYNEAVVQVIEPYPHFRKISIIEIIDEFEKWRCETGTLPGPWLSYSELRRNDVIKEFFKIR